MESWAGQLSVAVVGRVRPGVALRPGCAGGEAGGQSLKSRYQQGHTPSEGSGEEFFLTSSSFETPSVA